MALNSWGSDWGNNGCLWISYQDLNVETGTFGVINAREEKENISNASINISKEEYILTEEKCEPYFSVSYYDEVLQRDKILQKGIDYTYEYENNDRVGTAYIKVYGIGRYTGVATEEFQITPLPKIDYELNVWNNTYDGNSHGITINVLDPKYGATVRYGTEPNNYNLSNSPQYVDVGRYDVYYQISATGYSLDEDVATIEITAKDISNMEATLETQEYVFDGIAKKPSVKVKDGTTVLIEGNDYYLTYDNNINMGEASITITGKGNYKGTIRKTFEIKGANIIATARSYFGTYDMNSHGISVTVTEPANGAVIKYGTEEGKYDLDECPSYRDAGTYTVYYKVSADGYKTSEGKETITINAKDIKDVEVTLDKTEYTYNGTEKKPSVVVKEGTIVLVEGVDYKLEYGDNKEVGIAKVKVFGKGNYAGETNREYKIEKAMPNYTVPADLIAEEGKTLRDVKLPEGFSWEGNMSTSVGRVGENTFKCTYTPNDTKNYKVVTGIEVKIKVYEKVKIKEYTEKVVDNKTYVEGISAESSIEELKKNISTSGMIKLYDSENKEVKNTIIKTGMKMEIENGGNKVEYALVVTGDLNGDGKVTGVDLLKLARHLTDLDNDLKGAYLMAGNVYKDKENSVNSVDLLKMARVLADLDRF